MNNIKTEAINMKPEIKLNENIVAPINHGEELGTIKYNVDGVEYTAKLLAENDVELKTYYLEISIGAGIFVVIVIILVIIRKRKNQ